MVALVETNLPRRRRDPRNGPPRDRQTQSRPAEGIHLQLQAPTKAFNLQLKFTKSRVERDEVIEALEGNHQRAPRREVA